MAIEPPYAGTVYVDADIFTADDPSAFESLTYDGRGERVVYDSRFEPKTTTKNVFLFTVKFDDAIQSELQLAPDFNTQEEAASQADFVAQALSRLPAQLRRGIKAISVFKGNGRANASLATGTIRIYSEGTRGELLEELLAHEGAHVSLDPFYRTDSDWLYAQGADKGFISTYARDNFGTEDIAESVLPYLAIRYKPGRISAEDERKMQNVNQERFQFFDRTITDLHPMVDLSQEVKAKLIAPSVLQTLGGDQLDFTWAGLQNTQSFDLVIGTTGFGSSDIRASNIIGSNNLNVAGLPDDGRPVFARLWSQKNDEWRYDDFRFAGFSPNKLTADLRIPVPASTLPGSKVTFRWDRPSNASSFDLIIGTQGAGSNDVRATAPFDADYFVADNLPENNQTLYVRLWTNTQQGGWNYQDYEYKASKLKADLLSPSVNNRLTVNTVTFTWDKPFGASGYDLLVGTNGPGSTNIRSTQVINTNSLTLNNMPTNGQPIYVRLWTSKGEWRFTDYVFNSSN